MHTYRHSSLPPHTAEPVSKVSLLTRCVRVQLFDQVRHVDVHIIISMTEPSVGKDKLHARVIALQGDSTDSDKRTKAQQQECLTDVEHSYHLWDLPIAAASENSVVHC